MGGTGSTPMYSVTYGETQEDVEFFPVNPGYYSLTFPAVEFVLGQSGQNMNYSNYSGSAEVRILTTDLIPFGQLLSINFSLYVAGAPGNTSQLKMCLKDTNGGGTVQGSNIPIGYLNGDNRTTYFTVTLTDSTLPAVYQDIKTTYQLWFYVVMPSINGTSFFLKSAGAGDIAAIINGTGTPGTSGGGGGGGGPVK